MAEEWLQATAAVRGCPAEGIEALGLDPEGTLEEDSAHVRTRILTLRQDASLLVLTDLHGSTPSNLAAQHAADPGVSVVAGANLAMVLRLACDPRTERSLDELAEWICAKGRAGILPVSGTRDGADLSADAGTQRRVRCPAA